MENVDSKKHGNDTHAMPPQPICDLYKKYQKMDDAAVDGDLDVIDFTRGLTDFQKSKLIPVEIIPSELISSAQAAFKHPDNVDPSTLNATEVGSLPPACTVYEHADFPGLRLLPSLLPPESQWLMLDHLLHRELSNSLHINNLSQDYTIPYPSAPAGSLPPSFFKYPQSHESQTFHPTNPLSTHKALNTAQFLQKKLRWLTLGSQYDWSTRSYATTSLTSFPPDIAKLVTTLFRASFVPESGVVLLYSPKDYMPVHRDVSEESPRGLASFTLGCDGLFVIAKEEAAEQNVGPRDRSKAAPHDPRPQDSTKSDTKPQPMIVIRVRSGDVVQMGGPTRWAWHAMPKVMAGTCPKALQKWPVKDDGGTPREYERWKGYMRGKRLNISCRQVWESSDEASNDSANSNP